MLGLIVIMGVGGLKVVAGCRISNSIYYIEAMVENFANGIDLASGK
jgi:hypothetical protein